MRMRKIVAALTAAAVLGSGIALAQQLPPALSSPASGGAVTPATDADVQPRVVWGILINLAVSTLSSFIWDVFAKWLDLRVNGGTQSMTSIVSEAAVNNLTKLSGARFLQRSSGLVSARAADVVVGTPESPLKLDGGENYQGANIAIMVAEGDGRLVVRPVNQGFKTGERFKLRIVSTFNGELSIENINPRNKRRQIYPPAPDQVVALEAGKTTFIPLGADQHFEFTRATGREQLVINLADPRATGERASSNRVFRQDVKFGSNFVQEVSSTTYPRISQAIELQHSAK